MQPKGKTMLRVVGILFLVFASVALLGNVPLLVIKLSAFFRPSPGQSGGERGLIFGLELVMVVHSALFLAAGILGVKNCAKPKKAKSCFVLGVVLIVTSACFALLFLLRPLWSTAVDFDVPFFPETVFPALAALALPILYTVGAYQVKSSPEPAPEQRPPIPPQAYYPPQIYPPQAYYLSWPIPPKPPPSKAEFILKLAGILMLTFSILMPFVDFVIRLFFFPLSYPELSHDVSHILAVVALILDPIQHILQIVAGALALKRCDKPKKDKSRFVLGVILTALPVLCILLSCPILSQDPGSKLGLVASFNVLLEAIQPAAAILCIIGACLLKREPEPAPP